MNNSVLGNIVVKPHIYKFICWLEHIELDETQRQKTPLDIGDSGIVGRLLKMILTYKSYAEFYHKGELPKDYNTPLLYSLPAREWDRGKLHISKADVLEFNSVMHRLFHEFLLQHIFRSVEHGGLEKEAIEDFLVLIGAEEDVHWDSIKRVNLRLRNSKKFETLHDKKVKSGKKLITR